MLAALVITGVFRVWKNLPDVVFSLGFISAIDMTHLGLAMALILVGIIGLLSRVGWLKEWRGF